jgi:hypothetical protein
MAPEPRAPRSPAVPPSSRPERVSRRARQRLLGLAREGTAMRRTAWCAGQGGEWDLGTLHGVLVGRGLES